MKKIFTFLILPLAIVGLVYAIWQSVQEPVQFQKDQKARETIAIQRLKDIRTLQDAFKGATGHFTASIDSLINFYHNDSIKIIRQIGSMDDSLAVAQKRVTRENITIAVKDTLLKERAAFIDSLSFIPYSGGERIIMESIIRKVSDEYLKEFPLLEGKYSYHICLSASGVGQR